MKIANLLLVIIFLAPFVFADSIEPGQKGIPISNVITNIGSYPDYVFIQAGQLGPSMCPAQVIGRDGKIPGGYKFCDFTVYAVKKSDFGETYVSDVDAAFSDIQKRAQNSETPIDTRIEFNKYLLSKGATPVLSGIATYMIVPSTSTEESQTREYEVDLGSVNVKPNNEVTETNDTLMYFYFIVPLVAFVLIAYLLLRKRGK
jgi:hypothetical protein